MSGSYLLYDSILEKCGNIGKNGRAWADMAGLGSIGLRDIRHDHFSNSSCDIGDPPSRALSVLTTRALLAAVTMLTMLTEVWDFPIMAPADQRQILTQAEVERAR